MKIGGFQKFSLLDYPGKLSAIIFTHGCNFRCPYCHNPELLKGTDADDLTSESILEFLKTRLDKLDAVTISGGEPTIHPDLPDFISAIKELGFLIKLDTNGTNPQMLTSLMEQKLIDYIAMDVKAPLDKYQTVTIRPVDTDKISQSVQLIQGGDVNYEFRTTLVTGLLNEADVAAIQKDFHLEANYFIQNFVNSKTVDTSYANAIPFSDERICRIKNTLIKTCTNFIVR